MESYHLMDIFILGSLTSPCLDGYLDYVVDLLAFGFFLHGCISLVDIVLGVRIYGLDALIDGWEFWD
jgi:hypothetical protein